MVFQKLFQRIRDNRRKQQKGNWISRKRRNPVVPFPDEDRPKDCWEDRLPNALAANPSNTLTLDPGYEGIDLRLPDSLRPLKIQEFERLWEHAVFPSQRLADGQRADWTYGIGSCHQDDQVYFQQDTGLFQCVVEAWMNHWNLRTTPEDWWYPFACKLSKDLAFASKGWSDENDDTSLSAKIKALFSSPEFQDKQQVLIDMAVYTIEDVDYEQLFGQLTTAVQDQIQVPRFVEAMQCNFSTSQSTHTISSQINLLSSLQEFFDYDMVLSRCGLRGLELKGTQAEWDQLWAKLATIRELLAPLLQQDDGEDSILSYFINKEWLDRVEWIFEHLALTKREPTNPKVIEFWKNILLKGKDSDNEMDFYRLGPRTHQVPAYNGWLIQFLLNKDSITVADLNKATDGTPGESTLAGLTSVPLQVSMTWQENIVSEETQLLAGILGFQLVPGKHTFNGIPSLQPFHMWSMMIKPGSKLRRERVIQDLNLKPTHEDN